eukprot:gene7237-8413_t
MKLDKTALTNLSNHKYSGIDDSILAKYVLRHWWNFCMNFVPMWIAPNLLGSLTSASICGYGSGFISVYQLMATTLFPFWMATWEEYHTGTLHLGKINGPDEGIIIVATSYLVTAYFGGGFWLLPVKHYIGSLPFVPSFILNAQLNYVSAVILSIPTTVTCLVNIRNVVRHLRSKGKATTPALMHIFVWVILAACASIWYYTSTSLYGNDSIWIQYPRTVQMSIGLLFGELVSRLILSHMCHLPYAVFQKSMFPLIISTVTVSIIYMMEKPPLFFDERAMLLVCAVCCVISYTMFVKSTIHQLCTYLKINCLTIPYETSKSKSL